MSRHDVVPEFDRRRLPPGPKLPYALQTLLVWQCTAPFMRYCRRRYGPTFTVHAYPGEASVYVTAADDLKAVFTADPDVLHAGEANTILGPVLGRRSILLADEEEHLRRRRLMLPFFHGDSVRRYAEVVGEIADAEIATWPEEKPIRLHKRMQAITLEIILRAVLGVEDPARLARLRVVLRRIVELAPGVLLMWVWPKLGRVGIWRRQLCWQADAEALLSEEIANRRAAPDLDRREDILSMLICARYDDDSAMDDDELRDQLMTMLLAGHETTATGLAWAFERLARNPSVLARAECAVREGEQDYIDAVVKETLRSRPVIYDVARVAAKPFSLHDYDLPAGVTLMPSIGLAQQSEAFPDPDAFRPERFLGETAPPPYGWIPFGGGRRRCLGAAFATLEMRMVIERVLARVELSASTTRGEWALPQHITLVPARGTRLRIRHKARSSRDSRRLQQQRPRGKYHCARDSCGEQSGVSLPSLLATLPRSAQVQIAVLGPLLLGAMSGFLLDTSAVGYWAVQAAGTAGGVSSGMEHFGPAAGARRGLAAGALFGAGLMGAHAISNQRILTYVPHPLVLIALASAAIGAALGGVGGVARRRWEMQRG